PAASQRGHEFGRLGRPQAVKEARFTVPLHPRMGEAGPGANRPWALAPVGGRLDAAHIECVDVLTLKVRTTRRDKADAWKDARPVAQGHIRDRVPKSVDEAGER